MPRETLAGLHRPTSPQARSGRFGWVLGGVTVFWLGVLFWLGAQRDPFWRGYDFGSVEPNYYNLLIDGFSKGQLNLDVAPHFGAAERELVRNHRSPLFLDAALFHEKYYLYYGVAPAVVLLWPYYLVTGHHLGLSAACLAFAALGYLCSIRWYWEFCRHYGPREGIGLAAAGGTALAVLPGLFCLVRRASFYDLPICAGYAFTCALVLGLWKICRAPSVRWAVVSGLCFGLAVASRPDLIAYGLLIPAVILLPRAGPRRRRLRDLAAAGLPAGAIGIGLGLYNYARFGSPFDFGFSHGMNNFFTSGNPLAAWKFVWVNFRWYCLTPPTFAPWFPFVFPIAGPYPPAHYTNAEDMAGGFFPFLWVAAVSLAAATLFWRAKVLERSDRIWAASLGLVFLAELGFALALGIRAYRYATDFMAPLAFLVAAMSALVWAARPRLSRALHLCLGASAAGVQLLGAVQLFNQFKNQRPREFALLSHRLNPSDRLLSRWTRKHEGGVALRVAFSRPTRPEIIPLLRTGLPSAYDELQAIVHPGGYISLGLFHSGYGGPTSDLLPVQWGREYLVEAEMGSLYPAVTDPFFRGAAPGTAHAIKTLGQVAIDGRQVVKRTMLFYESAPWVRHLQIPQPAEHREDAVRIISTEYGKRSELWTKPQLPSGLAAYSLQLELDTVTHSRPFPVLCAGVRGDGNLLYLKPLPGNRYCLALDDWGFGALEGAPFSAPASGRMRLDIVVGPNLETDPFFESDKTLAGRDGELSDRLLVFSAGKLLAHFRVQHHLGQIGNITVGLNDAGFSSAEPDFNGRCELLPREAPQLKAVVEEAGAVAKTGESLQQLAGN